MIRIENKIPAKIFRENINFNFSNLSNYMDTIQYTTKENITNIDDIQALLLQQGTYIDSLEKENHKHKEEIKYLNLLNDINETQMISMSLMMQNLEEKVEEIQNKINKPSFIRASWAWLTYTDGCSTPRQKD